MENETVEPIVEDIPEKVSEITKLEFTDEQWEQILDLVEKENQLQTNEIVENLDGVNKNLETVNDNILTLNDSINTQTETDYTSSFSDMIASMNSFTESIDGLDTMFEYVQTASSSIITYSVFYVPLIIVSIMLWWFFKQFIR